MINLADSSLSLSKLNFEKLLGRVFVWQRNVTRFVAVGSSKVDRVGCSGYLPANPNRGQGPAHSDWRRANRDPPPVASQKACGHVERGRGGRMAEWMRSD
jgi:hypothetical protein